MHVPLLNYLRRSSHFSESPPRPTPSLFNCGFLSSFFKREIWGASVISVWEVDGLGMKVMKRKRSCNENLRTLAFDAKQMRLSIFPFFFLWVSLNADCCSCLIFNMPDITRQHFSLAAYYYYPNTICHQHGRSLALAHRHKMFLIFPLKARFIKIGRLLGTLSLHAVY